MHRKADGGFAIGPNAAAESRLGPLGCGFSSRRAYAVVASALTQDTPLQPKMARSNVMHRPFLLVVLGASTFLGDAGIPGDADVASDARALTCPRLAGPAEGQRGSSSIARIVRSEWP